MEILELLILHRLMLITRYLSVDSVLKVVDIVLSGALATTLCLKSLTTSASLKQSVSNPTPDLRPSPDGAHCPVRPVNAYNPVESYH